MRRQIVFSDVLFAGIMLKAQGSGLRAQAKAFDHVLEDLA
jgi:hypothetical protein